MKFFSTMFLIHTLTCFIFILVFSIFFVQQAQAADFTVSYNTAYEIKPSETLITQEQKIKNLNSRIFASNYKITISNLKIYDVEAYQGKNKLKISVGSENSDTTISVKFENPVVGQNSDLTWKLMYKTKDIALRNGRILEVSIPKVSISQNVEEYNVSVLVDESYGKLMSISPKPSQETLKDGKRVYTFSKEMHTKDSISATFGDFQLYNLKLSYHLTNPYFFSKKMSIALPPDISGRQQIIFRSLSKTPLELKIDQDGNYIAYYKLPPKGNLQIEFLASAKVYDEEKITSEGGKISEIPQDLKRLLIRPAKFWETNALEIKGLSNSTKNNEKTVSENAKLIYDLVINKLEYNHEKASEQNVVRLGALKSLTNTKQAICMEFVDLFVALARASGIPAREINGYAFTQNQSTSPLSINLRGGDILHAWAEYYDPNFGWVQVDPTWEDTSSMDFFTKLDTNHIAFVRKGSNSESPLPAGAYKTAEDKKQVDVSVSSEKEAPQSIQTVEIRKVVGFNLFKILKGLKKVRITNTGNVSIYNINELGENIPPYGSAEIYMKVDDSKAVVKYEDFDKSKKTIVVNLIS